MLKTGASFSRHRYVWIFKDALSMSIQHTYIQEQNNKSINFRTRAPAVRTAHLTHFNCNKGSGRPRDRTKKQLSAISYHPSDSCTFLNHRSGIKRDVLFSCWRNLNLVSTNTHECTSNASSKCFRNADKQSNKAEFSQKKTTFSDKKNIKKNENTQYH